MTMQEGVVVVFDLGGVLIDWNPEYLYRELIPDHDRRQFFLNEVCHGQWNARMDAGASFAVEVAQKKAEHPQFATEIEAYWKQWPRMLGQALEESVAILREVEATTRVFALTNWSAETYPFAQERFDFLHCFEGILVSGQEKVAKPNPQIYGRFCSKFCLEPRQLLFIDDRAENIEAAVASGWQGVLFSDAEALRRQLREKNVL